jgi:two-component system, chemotaxis family, chemotaxis protein CheY
MSILLLLIEDDAHVREAVRHMLESWKLTVIEAEDGSRGVALFRSHNPSFVITDILMPEIDGIEAIREIRSIGPRAKVIAMSGGGVHRYENPLALAQEVGAAVAIEKPFRRQQLRSAIDQVLDGDWGKGSLG